MNWLQRMMYGRYGNDQLGNFLFVLYLIIFVIQMLLKRTPATAILVIPSYAILFVHIFRTFSKNIYKRQRENQKFLQLIKPVKDYMKFLSMRFRERHSTKVLYRCSKCHQVIRVPKGRGKIAITCPKCRFEFIKKT